MRVIVCGGRKYRNEAFIWRTLDKLHAERQFTAFMQGGAAGADRIAKEWANTKQGLNRWVCKADWDKYGKAAGPLRNARMIEWKPDLVVAFPDPDSKGTWDMVERARAAGVEVIVCGIAKGLSVNFSENPESCE